MEGIILDPLALVNTSGQTINPASDDSLILLRRIVKLLESNAVVDLNNRQKVTIDSVVATIATMGVSVAAGPNTPTLGAPIMPGAAVYWQPVWEGPVEQRWRVMEDSHISYAQNIRNHLSFT